MSFDISSVAHNLTLECFDDHVKARAGSTVKSLSYQSVLEIWSKHVGREAQAMTLVPARDMLFLAKGLTTCTVATYTPEHTRKVRMSNRGGSTLAEHVVPFPNLVIEYNLKKGAGTTWQVSSASFYMTHQSRQQCLLWYANGMRLQNGLCGTFSDSLSNFATLSMPNIYEGGSICLGGNHISPNCEEDNYGVMDSYLSVLLEQPFSADLSVPSVRGDHRNAGTWLRFLDGKTSFPYDVTTLPKK